MLVSNGHVQLECSIFSPQQSLPFIKPGEKREGLEMLEQEEKAMKSLPPSSVPFRQARHLSDGFSQDL